MKWFSLLKVSRKEAIADAKRFAPKVVEEAEKDKQRAYNRFRAREGRNPNKKELREEIINPVYRQDSRKEIQPIPQSPKLLSDYANLIDNVITFLKKNNEPINENSIVGVMAIGEPSPYILKLIRRQMEKMK